MRLGIAAVAALALLLPLVAAQSGLLPSCRCKGRPRKTFKEAEHDDVIFGALVSNSGLEAQIKVRRTYAGCLDEQDVITVKSEGACGVDWNEGKFFLLFLTGMDAQGRYTVGKNCDGNRLWSRVGKNLKKYLKNNARPCNPHGPSPPPSPPPPSPAPTPAPSPPPSNRGFDLRPSERWLFAGMEIEDKYMTNNDCAVQEKCVSGTGWRKLLRFTAAIENVGNEDFIGGNPQNPPSSLRGLFEYHQCHRHWHFNYFSSFELDLGNSKFLGHKQSFCLMDSAPNDDNRHNPPPARGYDCGYMGISAGWMDVYGANLDCQWVDITGLQSAGQYTLRLRIDPDNHLHEANRANNVINACVYVDPDRNIARAC